MGIVVRVQTMASVRKTYKEKLRPTPAQERALAWVLGRCRTPYNTALEQRILLGAENPAKYLL
jgi:hypothetical protein